MKPKEVRKQRQRRRRVARAHRVAAAVREVERVRASRPLDQILGAIAYGVARALLTPRPTEARCGACGHAKADHCGCGAHCLAPEREADRALGSYTTCKCGGFAAAAVAPALGLN